MLVVPHGLWFLLTLHS
jgi:hypothetical protein